MAIKILFNLDEAGEALGISSRTVRYYVHRGVIKARRGPRDRILIPYSELEKMVENMPVVKEQGDIDEK